MNITMIQVACGAMFTQDGYILMGQRHPKGENPFYWEFPGGKCLKNESLKNCLHREWKEELNLEIHIEKEIYANVSNGYECVFYIGTIIDIENLEKKVHNKIKFCNIEDIHHLKLFEEDKEIPIILQSYFVNK